MVARSVSSVEPGKCVCLRFVFISSFPVPVYTFISTHLLAHMFDVSAASREHTCDSGKRRRLNFWDVIKIKINCLKRRLNFWDVRTKNVVRGA